MASNYTSNYNLCQWEASDKVLRTEFNEDNAKIDAAIKAVDNSKASTSALNSLKATVNGKASQSALDALTQTVNTKADKSALDSLSSTVSGQGTALGKRNCAVHCATYSGNGNQTRTFTYSGKPWLVLFFRYDGFVTIAVRGSERGFMTGSPSACNITFSWSGNSLTAGNAPNFINYSGQTYVSIAFLEP